MLFFLLYLCIPMGLTGFDSGQKRYVSMPGIEFKPVNPRLEQQLAQITSLLPLDRRNVDLLIRY